MTARKLAQLVKVDPSDECDHGLAMISCGYCRRRLRPDVEPGEEIRRGLAGVRQARAAVLAARWKAAQRRQQAMRRGQPSKKKQRENERRFERRQRHDTARVAEGVEDGRVAADPVVAEVAPAGPQEKEAR